jgi:glutamate formiminotransferase/formiminotetrahydrofolate cyclodeaminase
MSVSLVECIPNFSEARRPEVVEKIMDSIRAVSGITILDHHSDLDHNRTVVTFVGSPQAVEEAAFQAISQAGKLIDLDQHTGAHPRIGATDVVPFVPLSEVTMQDCIEIARRLGKRVGDELKIPVYLYEDAATRPERQNLENIRKGQYEALKEELGEKPERDPDFGPKVIGPAGATVIGARQPLIAFNVYLATDDVSIAQKIARAVRHSSGGMRFVKAMGILVDGRAQVSMNLTNYRQSPIFRVVEIVRREAMRYGVGIHHTELVGLTPQDALVDSASWYLQLDQFEHQQLLEKRLFEIQQSKLPADTSIEPSFLDKLASATPTPGGGCAAAYTGAEAAALVAMVARLTVGKKKYAAVEPLMWPIIDKAEGLRLELTRAIDEDAAAFDTFMVATKLPKDTEEQIAAREKAIQAATLKAAQVPLMTAGKALDVMGLAVEVAETGNTNALSDAGTACALAKAAITGAGLNVRTNCLGLSDPSAVQDLTGQLEKVEKAAAGHETKIKGILEQRGGLRLP